MHRARILKSSVLTLLRQLIQIPSVNPRLAPDEGSGEIAIAKFARQWLEANGLRAWLEDVAPNRPNVVAQAGSALSPTLVLCAHLDTVSVKNMTIDPFEPRIEGNRVYGRGSYDMKGGVTAAMIAAAAIAKAGVPGRLLVALVVDEEYESLGAQHFVKNYMADACIVTEPSEEKLILAHKGFMWLELITRGRAAHGSRYDIGVSAIGKMGRIIAELERFDRDELRSRQHALLGPASQHCAVIEGGTGLSTYSEKCVLQLERRTLPGESAEEVIKEVTHAVARAGEEAEIRVFLERPPLTCDRQSRIAECLRQAANAVNGSVPEESGVGGWMDAAFFASAGIPTVNYGAGGAGAHEAIEWVELDSVFRCTEVLRQTAERFFAS